MYKITFLALIFSTYSYAIDGYEAEYRFKSSQIDIKGVRQLMVNDEGESSLTFKAKSTLARLYFKTVFSIQADAVNTKSYEIEVKPGFVNRDQEILIDTNSNQMSSKGRDEWILKAPKIPVVDPLNAQIQIRIMILNGFKEFKLNLLEIKNGSVESNNYKVTSENKICNVGETQYSCIEVTRLRENEDRKTTYLMAKELGYMFVEIKDVNPKRTDTLTLEKILSLG